MDFQKLLKSADDSILAQIVDERTDSLFSLLSAIPPENAVAQDEDLFRSNKNLISKMTTVELVVIGFSIILFFAMILKHFRYDWGSSPKSVPHLTASEIAMLMGKNIKRLCKNLVTLESYF